MNDTQFQTEDQPTVTGNLYLYETSLDSPSGQRTAQLNDILTNQLEPLVNDIINEFSGSILPDELDQLLDRLSVLLDDGIIPPKRFRSMN